MKWIYDDGGREAAGFKGSAGDCVVRSIAIVTGRPYRDIYDELNNLAKTERPRKRSSARNGVKRATIRRYLEGQGYIWVPCMQIGSGCQVHLTDGELSTGRLIVSLSKHLTAVVDGIVRDTHDPQRETGRCVYGYWHKEHTVCQW